MKSIIVAQRRYSVFIAFALLQLPACGNHADDEASAGCLAGNRSQCVQQVALGDHFGCARAHDRTVWCWGANDDSQLGYTSTDLCPETLADGQTQSIACHTFPFQVPGLTGVARVAAGEKFACALLTDRTVQCWGANSAGQLGNGATQPSMKPVAVQGLSNVTALALGARHACAVSSGSVFCWGADDALQLGVANPSKLCGSGASTVPCETTPKRVNGVAFAASLAAGDAHTCAVAGDGSVSCWGANNFGQLGNGAASDAPTARPQIVHAGHLGQFARDIAAGASHTCTLRDDGAVFCWGRNDHGELGSAPAMTVPDHCAAACSPTPLLVAALPDSPKHWDIEVTPDGGGDGGAPPNMTQLPDLSTLPDLSMPTVGDGGPADLSINFDLSAVPSIPAANPPRAIAAGGVHACALLSDGSLRCWGDDTEGQLGDGRRVPGPSSPVVVIAQPGAARDNPLGGTTFVVAGAASSCARVTDGSLRCWGSNVLGALGDGDLAPQGGPTPLVW